MVRYFEEAKTSVTIEGRNKVITYTALTCIKATTIRPATSYSGLYNKRQSGLLLCMVIDRTNLVNKGFILWL